MEEPFEVIDDIEELVECLNCHLKQKITSTTIKRYKTKIGAIRINKEVNKYKDVPNIIKFTCIGCGKHQYKILESPIQKRKPEKLTYHPLI